METTMTKQMAVSAVREICARPRRGANTAHAGTFRSVQGRTVSFAGGNDGRDLQVADVRTGVDATAPITGVVCPRLEAPPV
ncbi:MAG TPA: hypothetical protein VES93_16320 [Ornithinibacter sp.]|nr:hypothetical protein [Ornithinibacter sp.]